MRRRRLGHRLASCALVLLAAVAALLLTHPVARARGTGGATRTHRAFRPGRHLGSRRYLAPVGADLAPAQDTGGADVAQPVLGMPASGVNVIGASPGEAPGETWAQGVLGAVPATVGGQTIAGGSEVLMRYTSAAGAWQVVPLDDASGSQIAFHWQAAETTSAGGVALLGSTPAAGGSLSVQTVVTRDPGAAFVQAPAPASSSSGLQGSETLLPSSGPPAMAAIDESGQTGVLIAPADEDMSDPGVLHYVGGTWSREPLCTSVSGTGTCAAPSSTPQLEVRAISASSPQNAWLLATPAPPARGEPELFQRQPAVGGGWVWVQQSPASWLLGNGSPPQVTEQASLPSGPILTASGSGVWIDFNLTVPGQSQTGSGTLFVTPAATGSGEISGTWCYPTSMCSPGAGSLAAPLDSGYGSIAWPGTTATDPGTRLITGLPGSAMLLLSEGGGDFVYKVTSGSAPESRGGANVGPGGEATAPTAFTAGGAGFSSPNEGWFGIQEPTTGGHDSPQIVHETASPASGVLTQWPVPFRQPLLAAAAQPGVPVADGQSEALAVGVGGEIARYHPGEGWIPEYLYNSAGVVQTPTLRGIAWPEPDRAYAVGDGGAMWLWRSDTDLWEPDPAKPVGFHGNLTAIAFNPANAVDGYAVGKQGVLLAYGKTWAQQPIPAQLNQPGDVANFTSVTFAGGEAIAAYRMVDPQNPGDEEGGLIVDDGSGWQFDPSINALLAALPPQDTIISQVAGLPDGGAVAAGPGIVLERDGGPGTPWRLSSLPLADSDGQNIAALAAVRSGSSVQALVAVDDDVASNPNGNTAFQEVDNPPAPAAGQPPLLIGPDPLPSRGFLIRETATGWVDQQYDDYPNTLTSGGTVDLPGWPDPIFALLVNPSGSEGWAVGGETGQSFAVNAAAGATQAVETAGIQRFGPGATPPASANSPIAVPSGQATFAFGGGSGCAAACAEEANQDLGPEAKLGGAIERAADVPGVRAFLYAGSWVGASPTTTSPDEFDRELYFYAHVLSASPSLPVYAAASPQDVDPAAPGDFAAILGSHAPAGTAPDGLTPPAGTAAYAFDSAGSGGTVRVIVLDYSAGSISADGQLAWLASQLDDAGQHRIPAIVVGSGDLTDPSAPNYASDASAVQQVLLAHGASAYLFHDESGPGGAGQNVSETIGAGSSTIPAYGSGTIGYVAPPLTLPEQEAFLGTDGFMMVSVNVAERSAATNRAPVTVSLVPNTGSLALDPVDGTLLRRSQVALFQGLAREPMGGEEFVGNFGSQQYEASDPYTVLPETCLGAACARFVEPGYEFTSSNPQIGAFVKHDPNSIDPRQILLDSSGHPIPDPSSGLFCAYNPGTTTVTIAAGGLSYSMQVTVQAGSVAEPCGTVPVSGAERQSSVPPPPPPPAHTPQARQPHVTSFPPPPPPPLALTPRSAPLPKLSAPVLHASVPPYVQVPPPVLVPTRPLLPLPGVTARPIPPSGFAEVPAVAPLPVRVLEEERKEEEAVESAQNNYASYRPDDGANRILGPVAVLLLALAVGGGGAGLRRRRVPAFARSQTPDPYRRK